MNALPGLEVTEIPDMFPDDVGLGAEKLDIPSDHLCPNHQHSRGTAQHLASASLHAQAPVHVETSAQSTVLPTLVHIRPAGEGYSAPLPNHASATGWTAHEEEIVHVREERASLSFRRDW